MFAEIRKVTTGGCAGLVQPKQRKTTTYRTIVNQKLVNSHLTRVRAERFLRKYVTDALREFVRCNR
jgi:hypothetical protein